jgi:hypothetical protein
MTEASFRAFFYKVASCQTVTYFFAGTAAYVLFDYKTLFESGPLSALMRPMNSPWVALGPALQPLRGLVFALALFPFRRVFLEEKRGWLWLWGLFLGLAILSPAGPSPGSIEGLIYTKLSLTSHLRGLPEVMSQTLALSALLVAWHRKPRRGWSITMGILTGLIVVMSIAGAFLERPDAFR